MLHTLRRAADRSWREPKVSSRIGFLGCGQMARALARGFVRAGVCQPQDIAGSDPVEAARARFREETGADVANSNHDLVQRCEVIIAAVKPQSIQTVLEEVRGGLTADRLLVSIAAGVPLSRLSQSAGSQCRLIRVMPNTPCLVGAAASAFAAGQNTTPEDRALVRRLFESVGVAYEVSETLLDAVTGLSGSGPAFVYQVIEALSDGGVRAGLPRDVATALAAQTVMGAARMVLDTGLHPAQLKDMVASPQGTTIAGLAVLESRAVRSAFLDAVVVAAERSRQLGAT